MGYSVFCDWIAAPEAHRDAVSPANAAFIRAVTATSTSLLFLDTLRTSRHTDNTRLSDSCSPRPI